MTKASFLFSLICFTILLSGLNRPIYGQTHSAPDGQLVLIGGTIYTSPTENPIKNGILLIRNGKIAAVDGCGQPAAGRIRCGCGGVR